MGMAYMPRGTKKRVCNSGQDQASVKQVKDVFVRTGRGSATRSGGITADRATLFLLWHRRTQPSLGYAVVLTSAKTAHVVLDERNTSVSPPIHAPQSFFVTSKNNVVSVLCTHRTFHLYRRAAHVLGGRAMDGAFEPSCASADHTNTQLFAARSYRTCCSPSSIRVSARIALVTT